MLFLKKLALFDKYVDVVLILVINTLMQQFEESFQCLFTYTLLYVVVSFIEFLFRRSNPAQFFYFIQQIHNITTIQKSKQEVDILLKDDLVTINKIFSSFYLLL